MFFAFWVLVGCAIWLFWFDLSQELFRLKFLMTLLMKCPHGKVIQFGIVYCVLFFGLMWKHIGRIMTVNGIGFVTVETIIHTFYPNLIHQWERETQLLVCANFEPLSLAGLFLLLTVENWNKLDSHILVDIIFNYAESELKNLFLEVSVSWSLTILLEISTITMFSLVCRSQGLI